MANQALPNDILHLIFSQLDSVRFICRKIPRINSEWRYWATSNIRSLVIHPRDNYKRLMSEVYDLIIKNASLVFPNVKDLTTSNPKTPGQLKLLLAKFPKLEKLKLYVLNKNVFNAEVELAEIPSYIKELIIENFSIHCPSTAEPNLPPIPVFDQLQIYKGPVVCSPLKYLPENLKELYISDRRSWHSESSWTGSDLKKFTALEVLHVESNFETVVEYLKTSPQRLRDLFISRETDVASYLSQKSLPALKKLQFSNEDLTGKQLAEYKDMEIVDCIDRYYVLYDERFLKNNPDLVRVRLSQARHMSDLNYLRNLKELILTRETLPSVTMKKVLTIPTLEKLHLINGTFLEDQENMASHIAPNYNIKELIIRDAKNETTFMRTWAHLFHGLVKVKFSGVTHQDDIYSTYMKNWTRLEQFKVQIGFGPRRSNERKWHFPVFPNLRIFKAYVAVEDDIFDILAHSPNLEVAIGFQLGAGSTSAFLLENKIYGFLKASKSLYNLTFTTCIPFKLVRERVESFVMPEADIYITYLHGRSDRRLFSM